MTDLSIVVPTFNEAGNIGRVIEGLATTLGAGSWEVIVVDDNSSDGTGDIVRKLAEGRPNIRCLQRIQDRGSASAVHWGVQAAHGETIVVMGGDLRHDPAFIPAMLDALAQGSDIASAARPMPANLANRLTNLYLGRDLADPLTGYFATSRRLFLRSIPRMQGDAFRVFFDLVHLNRKASLRELASDVRAPIGGRPVRQTRILWALLCDVLSKLSGGLLPPRLVSFVGVGVIGSSVHFSVLYACLALGAVFWVSQALATIGAMVFNFTINNILTYPTTRLRSGNYYKGLLLYSFIASFGIVANVSTAQLTYIHFKGHTFAAACMGIFIDVIWRFVVSNRLIWGRSSLFRKAAA
jgi:dolichol-phosphate mannosyltransferase